jgi:thiamine transport system permease protein
VTVAAVKPAIASAAVVVALFCLTSFGVIVALGGASVGTIEVEVWYLSTRALDLGPAAVLAAAQLAIVLVLVMGYQRLRPTRGALVRHPLRQPASAPERRAVRASVAVVALVSGLPLLALVIRSLRSAAGWTLGNYRGLVDATSSGPPPRSLLQSGDALGAIGYSMAGAALATLVALAVSLPVVAGATRPGRTGRWFERAMVVPLAVSAATLGLGFLLAFSGPTVDLRGAWIAVPLVQAATAAPVVVLILLAAVRALDPAPIEAAAVAGAGPARRLRTVVWPALRRPFVVAAGFAFAMSVGEFGATVFLVRQDRPTVPVLIGRLLGRPGSANLGQALALSCLLGMIAAAAVLVADRSSDAPAF